MPAFSQAVADAQAFMRQRRIPAWLVYDYRGINPVFRSLVGDVGHLTRPSWLLVPQSSDATLLLLAHHVDAGRFTSRFSPFELPVITYQSRRGMVSGLQRLLAGLDTVAMEYSPRAELPRASRVDAGTLELVRSLGVRVVSSADLFQYATLRWTPEQLASHRDAAAKLTRIVERAFGLIRGAGARKPTEWEVAQFIRDGYASEGLEATEGPTVAVNAHASDPHFEPSLDDRRRIQAGDWVLIDLWARGHGDDAMYADITWVGYVGDRVPREHQRVFQAVIGARDAALEFIAEAWRQGRRVQGWQVDRVARAYITKAGYGRFFTHRLGHSLGREVHGDAVNLDSWETKDTRELLSGLGVTIEPGIYLPQFGMRSEIDVYLSEKGPEVTTMPQRKVVKVG
jgi:Xaa-Pro aminopeptidase